MDILVIGAGGREHALVYRLNKSASADKIYITPGNGGLDKDAINASINPDNFDEVIAFCKQKNIDLVVVGPEVPLVNGITDILEAEGINVFGPNKYAAQIEGSKQFMKDLVVKYGVPTAEYEKFSDAESAKAYIQEKDAPIVVKTDGLAAGKGVTVAQTIDEALLAVDEMFGGKFGDSGKKIVIEEFLDGEEASFFAICDGKTAIAFGSAQDHKAVGEGDTGPNTGGMGTYSPTPVVTPEMENRIFNELVKPVIEGMRKDGTPYKGVIFAGVMIDKNGEPKLLEYNVRFGDPECQVLMRRFEGDLADILLKAATGRLSELNEKDIKFSNKTAICVVMAANGYPASYKKNTIINDVDKAENIDDVVVFHAGTKYNDNQLVSSGGRVLGVTALADDIIEAQTKVYGATSLIDWQDGFYRKDIGWRAAKRVKLAS